MLPLPRSTAPHKPFSHEELLRICSYYRNLLNALRTVQHSINTAIDNFNRTQHGRPSEPLSRLLNDLALIDANVRGPLLDEIMQVELCAIKWEAKSAKLRSEARRQQRKRQNRRLGLTDEQVRQADLTDAFELGDDAPNDADDTIPVETPDEFGPDETVISPTMARVQRGMLELPSDAPKPAPANETYKNSGLV